MVITGCAGSGLREQPQLHQHHRLVDDGVAYEIARRRHVGAETDVVAAEPQAFDEQHAAVRVQVERDTADVFERAPDDRRAPRSRDGIRKRHGQARDRLAVGGIRERTQLRHQRPRALEEPQSRRGEAHAAAVRLDELVADRVLQCVDAFAHRRLREPQPRGRLAHRPVLLQRDERLYAVQHILRPTR